MDWQACFREVEEDAHTEAESLRDLEDPETARKRKKARQRLSARYLQLARTDDIRDIGNLVKVEGIYLTAAVSVAQDRPERLRSLVAGLEQMAAVGLHAALFLQGDRYKDEVDWLFSPSRDREDGVPLDTARKGLKSHRTRQRNAIKECDGPDEERELKKSRLKFVENLERLYILGQKQALGLDPQPSPATST